MNKNQSPEPSTDISSIIESAQRLGVEIDEEEALQWLAAMAAQDDDEIVVDEQRGVFGHRVTMLDFSPEDLAHFRKVGRLVEFEDRPGVETALALSGSSAQSKIQAYPGDADYFERINIHAENWEQACQILADLIKEKALSTEKGPNYQLMEVKFGSYPFDVVLRGQAIKAGSPISWAADTIRAGKIEAFQPDGKPALIRWEEVALDPGWCKLDWVVADPVRGKLANASNMLDVTWEAPDGTITPLDGYLDPYFQEVYLEAESIPIFSKLARHVSADALSDYVSQLEKEVSKYLTKDINYGKAAKRMYNIFRLTGRYEEAAFLRELFDEPTTMLYQVWSLIRTADECCQPGSGIPIENVLSQADELILSVVKALEGDQEMEVVRYLLRFRDSLTRQKGGEEFSPEAEAARAEVINIVNNFFYEKLTGLPAIKLYIDDFRKGKE
ncbi:MAG: hypothetical protein PVG14_03735 [Anaerolineales bacterium]